MAYKDVAIGVLGRRRAGKSNLIASLGGRGQAPIKPGVVSNISVKLRDVGNAHLIVPAGLDDERALGVSAEQAKNILDRIDIALVVVDADLGWSEYERFLLSKVRFSGDPVIAVVNCVNGQDTSDLQGKMKRFGLQYVEMDLSAPTDASALVKLIAAQVASDRQMPNLVEGLIREGDVLWLVVPNSRPSLLEPVGPSELRLMKDTIELGATISVVREADFAKQWGDCRTPPRLVVTEASAYRKVQSDVPEEVHITTMGLLVARQRGELAAFLEGARAIHSLQPGDRVLIAEGCGLHVQPEDTGRFEIPNLLRKWVGGDLEFSTSGGGTLLEGISGYDLIVRCGTCMLDRATAQNNLKVAIDQHSPVTNYGVALAYMHGVLGRMIQLFVDAGEVLPLDLDESRAIPLDLHDELSIPPCM